MKSDFALRTSLILFLGIALALSAFPVSVDALTLTPVRFELSAEPGEVITKEILLINEEDAGSYFYSSFANFEAQGDSGVPSFATPTEGLGTWMDTDLDSVYLEPGQQRIVNLTISVPQNAEPGGYFASLFWGTSPSEIGSGIGVGSQTGILVLLSVKGEVREEAGLINFNTIDNKFFHQTLPVDFEYRFRNDGGDRIKPEGTLTIRNTIFWPTERLDGNPVEGNVLPNSTRKINVKWQKYERPNEYVAPTGMWGKFWSDVGYQWRNFAIGLYSANLNVAYGTHGEHAKGTAWFVVFPWQLALVLVIGIFIVWWGGTRFIKRYNRFIIERARSGGSGTPPSSRYV
jgi:hypothetical protein